MSGKWWEKVSCDETLPCKHYKKGWPAGVAGKCLQDQRNYCVNDFDNGMVNLSHTAKECFVHCRYEFYLRYILGINVKDSQAGDALVAGRLWDDYVGAFHLGKPTPPWPEYISETLRAKLRAVIKVHGEITDPLGTSGYKPQHWINLEIDGVKVAGAVDRAYDDHFVETKFSSRPDYYLKPHNVTSQLGTYFLANPKWQYAIVEVTRVPGLYHREDEDIEEYYKRVYQDIVKRPTFYFPGYNRDKRTFGLRIDRSDLNLDRVEIEYKMIIKEMRECIQNENYYHQYASCHSPFDCMYLPICATDTASETLYNFGGKR